MLGEYDVSMFCLRLFLRAFYNFLSHSFIHVIEYAFLSAVVAVEDIALFSFAIAVFFFFAVAAHCSELAYVATVSIVWPS